LILCKKISSQIWNFLF